MADDPFGPLRAEYLDSAQRSRAEIERLAPVVMTDPNARPQLCRLAHNLRGSGGFYGFQAISEAAGALEELLLAADQGNAEATPALITAAADRLRAAIHTAKRA